MPDGTVPARSVETLNKVGTWRRKRRDIYGTSVCPLQEVRLIHVSGPVLRGRRRLSTRRTSRKLGARDRDGIGVSLPAQSPDETDTVVVVELGGPLHLAPPIVTQGERFTVRVGLSERCHGRPCRQAIQSCRKFHVGYYRYIPPGAPGRIGDISWRLAGNRSPGSLARPARDSDRYLMYFQSLLLEPVGAQNVE